jgi:urease accessory protein UreH
VGDYQLEVIAPGRSDQRFTYSELEFTLEASCVGRRVVRERFRMTPAAATALGGYSHFGGVIVLGPDQDQGTADRADAALTSAGVFGSASCLPDYGIGVKALGTSARDVREALLCSAELPRWLVDLVVL